MKFLYTLALAAVALAAPLTKRQAVSDVDILQFALTLEHLENVFYKEALGKFSKDDFKKAGFSAADRTNVEFIAHDEEAHVVLLEKAISAAGATPVAACSYSFPFKDVKSFLALSSLLEGVGTSAYLGAAPAVQSKAILSVAGSILVTEAIHTSLQRDVIGEVAAANPQGTALGLNEVFTLAAAFITSCPSSNPPLPVKAFPPLTASTKSKQISRVGKHISFTTTANSTNSTSNALFATFVSGLDITSVPARVSRRGVSAVIPSTASGQTYVVLTNSNVTSSLMDSQVVAGPAVVEVDPGNPTLNNSIA